MSLQDDGFRFVYQDGVFTWRHEAEIKPEAIDCTEMTEDDFEKIVLEKTSVQ